MNREIKFRAWDSIAGKMWEDVYFDGGHIYTIGPDGENASTMPRWEDNAIMQFTGLLDKNGKEIYEQMVINKLYVVQFINCKYVLTDISSGDVIDFYDYYTKHENTIEITEEQSGL